MKMGDEVIVDEYEFVWETVGLGLEVPVFGA